MLESVLSLYFPAVMMLEVMNQTSFTSKRSSINSGPRRRKSACWTNSWQVFTNMFEAILVRMQWLLALVGGGNRLILQEGLLELLLELGWYLVKVGVLRTWSPPINLNCPSAVMVNCHQCGWDHVLRVELYVVEFWRVYFCPPAQGLQP